MHIRSAAAETIKLVNQMQAGLLPLAPCFFPWTPGGGKSAIPAILSRLIPQHADALAWFVPRNALKKQGEKSFLHEGLRELHHFTARIRQSTNDVNPCGDLQGFISTYDAAGADRRGHMLRKTTPALVREFHAKRYILILDEPHHLKTSFYTPESDDYALAQAIAPLIDLAVLTVYMSGTFERHDRLPILGLPYVQTSPKRYEIHFPDAPYTIPYGRTQALKEHAIIPLFFTLLDAQAEWINEYGSPAGQASFDAAGDDTRDMLEVALKTQFAYSLLDKTIDHWEHHKKNQYPPGRLLVVAPTIATARQYARHIEETYHYKAPVATIDDQKQALLNIDRFKHEGTPPSDILVTVGMAYEGLDVPEVTHVACLTRYRSKPWLEQCVSRACRTAYDNGQRDERKIAGYIFAPDDTLMRDAVEKIYAEQRAAAIEMPPTGGPGGTGIVPPPIVPLSSESTEGRALSLSDGLYTTREEFRLIQDIMVEQHIHGLNPLQVLNLVEALKQRSANPPPPHAYQPLHDLTPTEREQQLKKAIEEHCRGADNHYHDQQWGTTSGWLLRTTKRNRESIHEESVLLDLLQLLRETYPLPGAKDDVY